MRHSFKFKSTVNHPLTGAGIKYKSSDNLSKREGEKKRDFQWMQCLHIFFVLFKIIEEPPVIFSQAFSTVLVRLVTGKV